MQTHQDARTSPLGKPRVRLALLICVVLAGHGLSVTGGMWLDDHLHWQRLQQAGWNHRDLVDASTLDAATVRVKFWGFREQVLRFYRPIAFALMKVQYSLVRWNPALMHGFNLLWHLAVAYLVGSLAAILLGDAVAGTVASLAFASFAGHVVTTYWIACQTELMVTFFGIGAVLSYARWSGWTAEARSAPGSRGRVIWLVLAGICCAAAMGCRENGIVLPAVLIAGDLLIGRAGRLKRNLPVWLGLAAMVGGYLLLRSAALGGMAWPGRPYLVHPSEPGFVQFAARKLLYYLAGLFMALPVLPGAAMEYFAERTWLLQAGAALSLSAVALAVAIWRRRGLLLGAVWMVLAFLPLLPVAPAAHHLYLPGVGAAVIYAAVLVGLWRIIKRRWRALDRAEPHLGRIAVGTWLTLATAGCVLFGWCYLAAAGAEDQVVEDVLELAEPPRSGDEVFFINLPIMSSWVTPAIETTYVRGRGQRDTGTYRLQGYVLTPSDEALMMVRPTRVTPLDRYTLRLQTDPPGWLAGASGRAFAELCGLDWPLRAGQRIPGPAYDVVVEQTDPANNSVTSLRFEFREPIDKPGRHFYLGSFYRMAYPLHFRWSEPPTVTGPP